ncbi:CENPA [Enterospora canceri]|uniref:CENPA n=1 Tax=Enterospora canceri TaxID=1081671 RepID=A0A1Y1S860_9MICR|nr:CENPA [Enterospora canceri]
MPRTKQFSHSQTAGKKLIELTPNRKGSVYKPAATLSQTKKRVPGNKALAEVKKYQRSTALLVRLAAFKRIVRHCMGSIEQGQELRFQKAAFLTLQSAYEAFMTDVLEDACRLTVHAKRKTLFRADIQLTYKIKYKYDLIPSMTE